MYKIKVQKLTKENFSEYGQFYDFENPKGHTLGNFYHDHIIMPVSGDFPMAFSSMVVEKASKMIISQAEYHNTTSEAIIPLDDDIVIYLAPPSQEAIPEATEAFLVPKGTMVLMNLGVWHCSPFAVNKEKAHVLVTLPERIYKNDCTIIQYEKEKQIEIEF